MIESRRKDVMSAIRNPPPCDLRHACVHEFAHLAAARHFGAAGFVTIVRSRHGGDEIAYGGRFQLYGDLADDEWRVVALAGCIAELVEDAPALTAHDIVRYLRVDGDALSATDARLAHGYGEHDVERCLGIVKRAWREIDTNASERMSSEATGCDG